MSDGEVCEDGSEMMEGEMAKKYWMGALEMEDDGDGSEYDVDEVSVGNEVEMYKHDDEALSVDKGKASGVCEELELEAVLGEYDTEAKILFSLTQLDTLKEEKRFY